MMVCSPEISRINGSKSKGPRTERGKAIASLNAKKHGLLSTCPPLLATEDLATFEGMMQGLIDEYQPDTPTEHLLVQQVGMAWLRLHRLWATEAAHGNAAILKAQFQAKYPDFVDTPPRSEELDILRLTHSVPNPPIPWLDGMQAEIAALKDLINDLTVDLSHYPGHEAKPAKLKAWTEELKMSEHRVKQASTKARNHSTLHFGNGFWLLWDRMNGLLGERSHPFKDSSPLPMRLKAIVEDIREAAYQEIARLQQEIAEYKIREAEIAQAEANCQGLQDTERFSRYERHITAQLKDALDRLTELKQLRQNTGSMGSFG